jgi:hypothetical protein
LTYIKTWTGKPAYSVNLSCITVVGQIPDATGNRATMKKHPKHTPGPGNAELAMNEVLAADLAAAETIDACQQAARASLHEAARRARYIAVRTDERIARIHQRTRQQLQRHLRNAERAARAADRAREGDDPRMAVINAVATDLAARLTGADSSDIQPLD